MTFHFVSELKNRFPKTILPEKAQTANGLTHKWLYLKKVVTSTNIHQTFQNLRHLYPGMELNLGVFGFFLVIKKIAVRQVRMYCICRGLSVKIQP